MHSLSIAEAADQVREGGLIAYPTEAVYGLGCDPANSDALARLLALKQRDIGKGLILVAFNQQQLTDYLAPFPATQARAWQARLELHWPGPVTFLIPARPGLDSRLTGGRSTIAVRVSAHPVIVALCQALQHPLVSTSANLSGQSAIRNEQALAQTFGAPIDDASTGRDVAGKNVGDGASDVTGAPGNAAGKLAGAAVPVAGNTAGVIAGVVRGELGSEGNPSHIIELESGRQIR